MNVDQEARLLAHFRKKAEAGRMVIMAEVRKAYEEAVGYAVPESTVYRLLARHGWRKIVPRPRRSKADLDKQEALKKTSAV